VGRGGAEGVRDRQLIAQQPSPNGAVRLHDSRNVSFVGRYLATGGELSRVRSSDASDGRYFVETRAFSPSCQGRTTGVMFIAFRELTSARGDALLQLSKPIEHDVDLSSLLLLNGLHSQEAPSVRRDVITGGRCRTGHIPSLKQ